jgi:hypothetical protein
MIKKAVSVMTVAAMFSLFILTANAKRLKSYIKCGRCVTPDNSGENPGDNMRKTQCYIYKDGPYKTTVYNISSGPNAGNIIWEMVP